MPEIDEDILRQLMVRSTDDLFAPRAAAHEAIRHQRRRRMRTRVLAVAGTAAAAGLAVGVLASSSPGARPAQATQGGSGTTSPTVPIRLTAAQHTLLGLSAAAAATPRPSGRYVVQTETTTTVDPGSGGSTTEIGGRTSVIDTITGGGVMYQDITISGPGSAGTPAPPKVGRAPAGTSPTTAQLDAMPTATAKLRAVLLAQAKQQLPQSLRQGSGPAEGPPPTDDDLVFDQAANLLWDPNLSAALRAAVYKVLAGTSGVIVKTGAKDSSGRPAVEISRFDTFGKQDVETFENPMTGATLESAWVGPSAQYAEDLYLSITYTNTIPADPYKG